MRIQELRALSNEALVSKMGELRLELGIEERKIASTGVSSKRVKSKEMRRTIAQILTLLSERGVRL